MIKSKYDRNVVLNDQDGNGRDRGINDLSN